MKKILAACIWSLVFISVCAQQPYYPGADWQTKKPEELKMNKKLLDSAINLAIKNENKVDRDLRIANMKSYSREPDYKILGPTKLRGGPAGLVIKNGYIVAQWGDVNRVDMTFSVTKSFLSTVVGVAVDENLIKNVSDKVNQYVWDDSFEGEHNAKITWQHLLTQSSDWSGTLFGLHDWADRPPREGGIDDWKNRKLNEPGTVFKYNDVRVNLLAYSLLQVWRKPLPVVLKEKIMEPIGASTTWRWYGYENSFVNMDGQMVQSVSGGGHHGGGIFINAIDQARFGLLFLRNGKWNNRQLVSEKWITEVQHPSVANTNYGYMWWLNTDKKWAAVSAKIYYAAGYGGNYIVIDNEHDLVVVTRWIDDNTIGDVMKLVIQSIEKNNIMKRLIPLICVIIFGCNSQKNSDISKQLDQFLQGQAEYFRFNGNVLIAENGKTIFQHSFGMADFDSNRPLNDSSVFELASVSKQFTATAILLLKDKGKLKLTDSLRQYFPELPYSNITIWHMLTHTSGLPDYFWLMIEKWDHNKIAFNNDVIAFLAKEKLPVVFEPGTKWEYSNTAFVLLASIVEKISGQSYKEYMAENIFQPLGMNHSQVYNTRRSLKDTIANYAYGYGYSDSLKKYILPDNDPDASFVIYLDGIQGDGIINSTTADLLKWDRSIKNHTLLKEETQKEMLKEQSMQDTANKTYYGFGVSLDSTELGYMISHSGGWPGYTTFLARNTDKDQSYILLSNNSSNSPVISKTLQHIMAGKPVVMPYVHKEITLDSVALDRFTGTYHGVNEFKLERKGNKLFRVLPNGNSIEVKSESESKFFYADGSDRQIEFEIDANKKIIKIWFIAYGLKTELKKLN